MTEQITVDVAQAFRLGDMAHVVALVERLPARARNGNETALLAYGLALHSLRRDREAAAVLGQLVQLKPDVPEYWNNLATTARQVGEFDVAEHALRRAVALAPNEAQLHYHLGLLHAQQQHWQEARACQFEAVRLAPGYIDARLQGALACHACGDVPGEDAMLQGAAPWPPQALEQALALANVLSTRGEQARSFAVLDQAILPGDAAFAPVAAWRLAAQRCLLFERSNQLDQADAELAKIPFAAIASSSQAYGDLHDDIWHARAQLCARHGDHAAAAQWWEAMLDRADTHAQRAAAAFGLAAALDKLKLPAQALVAIRLAHAEQIESLRYVAPRLVDANAQSLPMVEQRVSHCEHDAWSTLPPPRAEKNPVFVVGFPRSGTTLLEQMLDAHPDFRSMDERAFIYDLLERMEHAGQPYPAALAGLTAEEARMLREVYDGLVAQVVPDLGAKRLVDKNPLNMLALPMIMRLYPEARIILCLRHPCDVLLSCYFLPFRSPSFATLCSTLPRLARGFVQVFEQWLANAEVFAPRVLEWRYESVVERFDEHVARLSHFLSIENAEPMKRYAEHARGKGFISTPSYVQVTQGVNRNAVNRWHSYREAFDPVLPILRPMLERFGYEA